MDILDPDSEVTYTPHADRSDPEFFGLEDEDDEDDDDE